MDLPSRSAAAALVMQSWRGLFVLSDISHSSCMRVYNTGFAGLSNGFALQLLRSGS